MPDSASVTSSFTNTRNRAVRIPREFELPGEDAIMRKDSDRAGPPVASAGVIRTLDPIDEDLSQNVEDSPPTTWRPTKAELERAGQSISGSNVLLAVTRVYQPYKLVTANQRDLSARLKNLLRAQPLQRSLKAE